MHSGKIIIISGPSGSGKTTLHKKLLLSNRLKNKLVKSISATTRSRRLEEKNGRDYLFLTTKQFLHKIKAGHFLEWQKVFENYYGTPKKNIKALLKAGKNVLLCIDVKGAAVVRREFPQAVSIFIQPPSFSVLKKRLLARGSETKEALKIRLQTARQEVLDAKNYNYTVINDDLDEAVKKLEFILKKELLPLSKGRFLKIDNRNHM